MDLPLVKKRVSLQKRIILTVCVRPVVRNTQDAGVGGRRLEADLVAIVGYVKSLVGVDVDVVVVLGLLWWRSDKAPNRQVVDEQLIPAPRQPALDNWRKCYM